MEPAGQSNLEYLHTLRHHVLYWILQLRKQTELRHGKAMEAAEAKFRQTIERVKRCAIEVSKLQFSSILWMHGVDPLE